MLVFSPMPVKDRKYKNILSLFFLIIKLFGNHIVCSRLIQKLNVVD